MKKKIKQAIRYLMELFSKEDTSLIKQDNVPATIFIDKAKHIAKGGKVITNKGIGSVIEISKDKKTIIVGLGTKDYRKEVAIKDVKQFYASYTTINGLPVTIPVSFQDYGYLQVLIQPEQANIYVTKTRKFAKLIDEEVQSRLPRKLFKTESGRSILSKLDKDGYIIVKSK